MVSRQVAKMQFKGLIIIHSINGESYIVDNLTLNRYEDSFINGFSCYAGSHWR